VGKIITISGRSGVGKSTVAYALESAWPHSKIIKSYTTRPPRDDDRNDYNYLSKSQFEERYSEFIYAVRVHENYYGTLGSDIQNAIDSDKYHSLVVSIETAIDICSTYPLNTIGVFLTADSEVVKKRLTTRGNSLHQVEIRVNQSEGWEAQAQEAIKNGVPIHFVDTTRGPKEVLQEIESILRIVQ
jgi:guanylate kinase